jgi:hypothetical protein
MAGAYALAAADVKVMQGDLVDQQLMVCTLAGAYGLFSYIVRLVYNARYRMHVA